MDREEALRILTDNMSDENYEHIAKIPRLPTLIVDSMMEFAQQQVKNCDLADVVCSDADFDFSYDDDDEGAELVCACGEELTAAGDTICLDCFNEMTFND